MALLGLYLFESYDVIWTFSMDLHVGYICACSYSFLILHSYVYANYISFSTLCSVSQMQSKSEALKTETLLLNTFDYAWNTTTNGSRRPDDVIKKLDKISSKAVQLSDIARKLLPFSQKQVGIRIKASKLPSKENESNASADKESHNFISRVFKFNRSRPRLVHDSNELIQKNTIICGVALGNGSICRSPPVKGRKRCSEHKGMKINTQHTIVVSKSSSTYNIECDGLPAHDLNDCMGELPVLTVKYPDSESFTPTCGFILPDGCSPCRSHPTKGNKRCHEHKGRRIRRSNSTLVKEKRSHYVADVVSESKTTGTCRIYPEHICDL